MLHPTHASCTPLLLSCINSCITALPTLSKRTLLQLRPSQLVTSYSTICFPPVLYRATCMPSVDAGRCAGHGVSPLLHPFHHPQGPEERQSVSDACVPISACLDAHWAELQEEHSVSACACVSLSGSTRMERYLHWMCTVLVKQTCLARLPLLNLIRGLGFYFCFAVQACGCPVECQGW